MWIKILICICVIAFCTTIGYAVAGKYRARRKFYDQFYEFNERYLNELSYARKPLSAFLKEYEYTGDFAKTLSGCVENRNCTVTYSYLTKEENAACADYFSMLGKGDSHSQKAYFSSRKPMLEEKRNEGEKQAKARGSLYLKLGLLLGLAIVILII